MSEASIKHTEDLRLGKKYNILVVDDEPHIAELVKLCLKEYSNLNFELYSARDYKQAFKIIKEIDIDLIILDLILPGLNGYEICDKIKSTKETENIKISILSVKNQMVDKLHAIDVGADDYIVKPFDLEILARKVRLLLYGYK